MKVTLSKHGGQAAGINLQRPPLVVDSAALDDSGASELKTLAAAAASAALVSTDPRGVGSPLVMSTT